MKTDLAKPKFASPPASLALALLLLQAAGTAIADAADEVRCREIGFSRAAEMRDAVRFESFIDADGTRTLLRRTPEFHASTQWPTCDRPGSQLNNRSRLSPLVLKPQFAFAVLQLYD